MEWKTQPKIYARTFRLMVGLHWKTMWIEERGKHKCDAVTTIYKLCRNRRPTDFFFLLSFSHSAFVHTKFYFLHKKKNERLNKSIFRDVFTFFKFLYILYKMERQRPVGGDVILLCIYNKLMLLPTAVSMVYGTYMVYPYRIRIWHWDFDTRAFARTRRNNKKNLLLIVPSVPKLTNKLEFECFMLFSCHYSWRAGWQHHDLWLSFCVGSEPINASPQIIYRQLRMVRTQYTSTRTTPCVQQLCALFCI